ncbi:K02A2.6-like [Cordylochernes scorpioides]|uniref:K02A2.6-like n=1 Tax=Cordylochernes scorpioides TaxID=51811 RepID=A0ABY6K4B3_9ARAC|nr:K02A2.6-like [Cordylochernes scorpioides]
MDNYFEDALIRSLNDDFRKLYREMVSNQLLLDALDAKMEEAKIKLNEEPIFKKMSKEAGKWIIVLTEYYTRYAETRTVSEATVKEVSKFLVEDIFLRHGAPQYLISDRGSQFTSNLMKEVMKMCKIKHCFTTSYHPQTNGLTEWLNRTLINMLSMYVNTDQKNWDEILLFITHAYNTTIQETKGYSPFFLMFRREATSLLNDRNISVDIDKDDYDEYIKHHLEKIDRTRKLVINNTIKTQKRMKKNYDKKHMVGATNQEN